MKTLETIKGWIVAAVVIGVGVVVFLLWKNKSQIVSNVSDFVQKKATDTKNSLAYLFGMKPAGALPNDLSNSAGAAAVQGGYDSVVNRDSQGFYNAAVNQYVNDNDLANIAAAQGTKGWPWKGYDDWLNAGEPHLPGEEAVYADSHGVYHNDYI